jgi:hypothetical protein
MSLSTRRRLTLDTTTRVADRPPISDDEIKRLIEDYVVTARRAQACGYDFVDVKMCHGYLGHEFLSAVTRPGPYGGSLENRTRFMREIIAGIRAEAPGLRIGVRLSAIDTVPFKPDPALSEPGALGPGIPEDHPLPYVYGFGASPDNRCNTISPNPRRCLGSCAGSASASSTSPSRVPITIRTTSGRRSTRRPTAITRRRIRSSASCATSRWCGS